MGGCDCQDYSHPHHKGRACGEKGDPNFNGYCSQCKTLIDAQDKNKDDLEEASGNIPE